MYIYIKWRPEIWYSSAVISCTVLHFLWKFSQRQEQIFDDLQKTMEVTREHLQSQLHQKDAECNHLTHNLDKLQRETTAQCAEVEHCQSMLTATREKSQRDKEALKKATRLQRERAQSVEQENEKLQKQIGDLLVELKQSKTTLLELTTAHKSLKQGKEFLEEETKMLQRNIMDIGETLELSTKTMNGGAVHVADKLCSKVRHLRTLKRDNENLKVFFVYFISSHIFYFPFLSHYPWLWLQIVQDVIYSCNSFPKGLRLHYKYRWDR